MAAPLSSPTASTASRPSRAPRPSTSPSGSQPRSRSGRGLTQGARRARLWTPGRARSSGTSAAAGAATVPSEATIWRILVRRGFVTPEPRKRPKASWRRFEATAPNELWQADAIDWTIATGQVEILSFLDDHSRVVVRVQAVLTATTDSTWDTFCQAADRWGLSHSGSSPTTGSNFSGRLRGFEVRFEIDLRAIGVVPKTSRPYHPQTCGKVERFQQTLKKWLRRQPLAADLAELQAQLDAFIAYYNHQRPHRGIARRHPAERWAATPPAINLGVALPAPARHHRHHRRRTASPPRPLPHPPRRRLAPAHRPRPPRRHPRRRLHRPRLVRALTLDPTRTYQPSGLPRGRPRRRHLP